MKSNLPKHVQIFLATIWEQLDPEHREMISNDEKFNMAFTLGMWETIKYFGWDKENTNHDTVDEFIITDLMQMNMSPEKFVQHLRDTLY